MTSNLTNLSNIPSNSFLGISVTPLTIEELNSLIHEAVSHQLKLIIANHNMHSVYIHHHDEIMREFYKKSAYVHIDGMPIVFLGKLFGYPIERKHRVTYADWIWPLIELSAEHNWKVYFLGSKLGVGERAVEQFQKIYPQLNIKTTHGYFDTSQSSSANQAIISDINSFRPNILLVGMGMPRQEYWILENFDQLAVNIVLPSGACMDYVAGEVPTPPRFLGGIGLEWLYRFVSDPFRLWKRYLVEPLFILKLTIKEYFGQPVFR